jgi:N utilization substance protein A
MTPEQLEEVPGVGPKTVEKISIAVNNYFSTLEAGAAAAVPEAGETAAVEGAEAAEPVAEIAAAEDAASEYVEAVETGQASEAAVIAGVENAPDADAAEVHTHGEEQPADAGLVEPELAKPDEESEEEPS